MNNEINNEMNNQVNNEMNDEVNNEMNDEMNNKMNDEMKNELNLSVFYGPQWAKMAKEDILETIAKFDAIHGSNENNIIIIGLFLIKLDLKNL